MRIKIQIGGVKDADILSLYYNDRFNLPKEMRNALRSYVRKTNDRIMLPNEDVGQELSLKPVQINIPFENTADRDILEWLSDIKQGLRTAAIKSVFRNKLEAPHIGVFMKTGQCIRIEHKTAFTPQKKTPEVTELFNKPQRESAIAESTEKDINTQEEWDIFSEDFITNY